MNGKWFRFAGPFGNSLPTTVEKVLNTFKRNEQNSNFVAIHLIYLENRSHPSNPFPIEVQPSTSTQGSGLIDTINENIIRDKSDKQSQSITHDDDESDFEEYQEDQIGNDASSQKNKKSISNGHEEASTSGKQSQLNANDNRNLNFVQPLPRQIDNNPNNHNYDDNDLDDDFYHVRDITKRKCMKKKGIYLYRVQWLNYDKPKYDTWEPEENLEKSACLLYRFNSNKGFENSPKIVKLAEDQTVGPLEKRWADKDPGASTACIGKMGSTPRKKKKFYHIDQTTVEDFISDTE